MDMAQGQHEYKDFRNKYHSHCKHIMGAISPHPYFRLHAHPTQDSWSPPSGPKEPDEFAATITNPTHFQSLGPAMCVERSQICIGCAYCRCINSTQQREILQITNPPNGPVGRFIEAPA